MKKQLELKKIAGYLPYGLKFQSSMDKPFDEFGKQPIWVLDGVSKMFGDYCLLTKENNDAYEITSCKPILFPLSSLTEFREDLGFVPIEKLGYGEEKDLAMTLMFDKDELIELPYRTIQKLYEWKIDIHNLIEKGLAIAVTEEFNPYK
jgi:hypothetical protein